MNHHKQNGIALAVSLVILLATTMLVVTSANKAMLNQKMANSHNKQTRAFLAAQSGIAAAVKAANTSIVTKAVATGSTSKIQSAWKTAMSNQNVSLTGANALNNNTKFNIKPPNGSTYWNVTKSYFAVKSKGRLSVQGKTETKRTIIVHIKPASKSQGPKNPIFSSALVAHNNISIVNKNSGLNPGLDAYNSNYGAYNTKVTANGSTFYNSSAKSSKLQSQLVRTCSSNGVTNLNGNAPIYGNVNVAGSLYTYQYTPILGNVHTNGYTSIGGDIYGNLTTSGHTHLFPGSLVAGNVLIGQGVNADGRILGSLKGRYLSLGYYHVPFGKIVTPHHILVPSSSVWKNSQPIIKSGSYIAFHSGWSNVTPSPMANYYPYLPQSQLHIPTITPVKNKTGNCGIFQKTGPLKMFTRVRQNPGTQKLAKYLNKNQCANGTCYQIYTLNGRKRMLLLGNLTIGTKGQTTLLKAPKNTILKSGFNTLNIKGNVTILVNGNFILSPYHKINIGPHASLRLLVTGNARLHNPNINIQGSFVRHNANGQPVPALSLYGNNQGSNSINLKSNSSGTHIALYAPKSNVSLTGSGAVYGSVAGKSINESNAVGLHYNRALRKVRACRLCTSSGGSTSKSSKARIISWRQK